MCVRAEDDIKEHHPLDVPSPEIRSELDLASEEKPTFKTLYLHSSKC